MDTYTHSSRHDIERSMRELWAELLEVDIAQIGPQSNFFELGGYSLLATRATWRICEIFKIDFPLSDFFQAANIEELGLRIQQCANPISVIPPLVPQLRDTPTPVSYAQERLWLLDKSTDVGAAYNVSMALRLFGALNVDALERSWTEIARRHECLRTHFGERDGVPYQISDPPSSFPLRKTDLTLTSTLNERDWQLESSIRNEQQHRFDLSNGPLAGAALFRFDTFDHVLVLCMHHIVMDGWSFAVLFRELSTLYAGFCGQKPPSLPELPIQYADYALWERSWLTEAVLDRELGYWRGALKDAPQFLDLPTDRPRPRELSFSGSSIPFKLPSRLCDALDAFARNERVTMFMVFLTAYQLLLSRYSGEKDIVVGAPIAGRPHKETEGLIGFFVNTLVLRTDLSGTSTFRELLQRVKEVTLGAYAHQNMPFDKLVMELRPERIRGRQPIFQVMLTLQNFPKACLELAGLQWTRICDDTTTSKFDLTLHLFDASESLLGEPAAQSASSERLCGTWEYSTELFEKESVERMSFQLRLILEDMVADPTRVTA